MAWCRRHAVDAPAVDVYQYDSERDVHSFGSVAAEVSFVAQVMPNLADVLKYASRRIRSQKAATEGAADVAGRECCQDLMAVFNT